MPGRPVNSGGSDARSSPPGPKSAPAKVQPCSDLELLIPAAISLGFQFWQSPDFGNFGNLTLIRAHLRKSAAKRVCDFVKPHPFKVEQCISKRKSRPLPQGCRQHTSAFGDCGEKALHAPSRL